MRWLEQVEQDAREAEEEACLAADLAICGQPRHALEHIERACGLEARYKNDSVWQPLRIVITECLEKEDGVLTFTLPKSETTRTRTVKVKSGK